MGLLKKNNEEIRKRKNTKDERIRGSNQFGITDEKIAEQITLDLDQRFEVKYAQTPSFEKARRFFVNCQDYQGNNSSF